MKKREIKKITEEEINKIKLRITDELGESIEALARYQIRIDLLAINKINELIEAVNDLNKNEK